MQIRDATAEDVEALSHLWHDAWHEAHARLVPPELTKQRTLESLRTRLAASLSAVRVAGPLGRPVGFHVVNNSLLDHLFVAASARGSGVAAALIADAERRIAESGNETAWLTAAVGNDRAARFYERSGWLRVGTMIEEAETSLGPIFLEVWRYEKRMGDFARGSV